MGSWGLIHLVRVGGCLLRAHCHLEPQRLCLLPISESERLEGIAQLGFEKNGWLLHGFQRVSDDVHVVLVALPFNLF